jgi:hypothetical protein
MSTAVTEKEVAPLNIAEGAEAESALQLVHTFSGLSLSLLEPILCNVNY